jgi:Fibronectin type III domain
MNSIRSWRVSSAFVLKSMPALIALTALAACGSSTNLTSETGTPPATVSVSKLAPAVTFAANATSVKKGATTTLTWSSTNATSCSASGGWSGAEATTGSQVTAALSSTTTFTLSCIGAGGTASQAATVTVTAPPTVSLSGNPASVSSGGSSTLSWSSTNATSCTASGGWSGAVAINGSQGTGALKASTVYTLSCTGPGGTTSQNTTVTVTAASSNGTATLSWNAPTTNTDGTPVTALAGYHIYYGTSEGAMTLSVAAGGAATTSYEITGLTAGTWYFSVAADAADGAEGPPSDIGSKTI